jgi:hypothetical protein
MAGWHGGRGGLARRVGISELFRPVSALVIGPNVIRPMPPAHYRTNACRPAASVIGPPTPIVHYRTPCVKPDFSDFPAFYQISDILSIYCLHIVGNYVRLYT